MARSQTTLRRNVMKQGSLVVCVDVSNQIDPWHHLVQDRIYTIRDIVDRGSEGIGLLLEEVVNLVHPISKQELAYKIKRFRELDCPVAIDLEEILELEGAY